MSNYSAQLSRLRIAPRKVRLVADLVRGTNVEGAQYNLQFSSKRAAAPLLKLLNSAVSNAKTQNDSLEAKSLYISKITVDEGPTFKRFRPVSRGRAHAIEKKTSHIILILSEREQAGNSKSQIANSKAKTTKAKREKN